MKTSKKNESSIIIGEMDMSMHLKELEEIRKKMKPCHVHIEKLPE